MGSPITLSGFNSIDFNVVLRAIMQQERAPVTQLEAQKKVLEAQKTAFSTLASKLASLESAADALTVSDAFDGTSITVSDQTRLTASGTGGGATGTYEIAVLDLARAQVTVSGAVPDRDTTTVASGGWLQIGGKTVSLPGAVTLQGLADTINATAGLGASASVVRNDAGYQLVLTGKRTGEKNDFAVDTAGLTGSALAFSNVQQATDARVSVNGVTAKSVTNTFDGVIAGLSFTVLKKDETNLITLTITASTESVKALIQKLVSAFNDVVKFLDDQASAANRGETDNLGRDPLVRGLRRTLTAAISGWYGSGSHASVALTGLEFDRAGRLTFDPAAFDEAVAAGGSAVRELFQGTDGQGGAFGALVATIGRYTDAGGLVPNAQTRLDAQMSSLTGRIDDLEARLEVRRAALQKEFIAADQAIAQLNASSSSLTALGTEYRLF
jgi:flagellar hook-associated protein 2